MAKLIIEVELDDYGCEDISNVIMAEFADTIRLLGDSIAGVAYTHINYYIEY